MIKAILSLLLLTQIVLHAQIYEIKEFESDVFSKEGNKLRQISLSLWLQGENLDHYGVQIKDSLNIIVSSFYLEDLLTSQGKEKFKTSFKNYLAKKYDIEIEQLYFNTLKRSHNNLEIDELITALKEAGYIHKNSSIKKVFESIEE